MTKSNEALRVGLLDGYRQLMNEKDELQRTIETMRAKIVGIDGKLESLLETAGIFGITLTAAPHAAPIATAERAADTNQASLRERVLKAFTDMGQMAMTKADLIDLLTDKGQTVNPGSVASYISAFLKDKIIEVVPELRDKGCNLYRLASTH